MLAEQCRRRGVGDVTDAGSPSRRPSGRRQAASIREPQPRLVTVHSRDHFDAGNRGDDEVGAFCSKSDSGRCRGACTSSPRTSVVQLLIGGVTAGGEAAE